MMLRAYRSNLDRWLVLPAIALGGALGALLRFGWISCFPLRDTTIPWAIFSENILGAFVLGWLLSIFIRRQGKHRYIRAFSGWMVQMVELLEAGDIKDAFWNLFLSILPGLLLTLAGIQIGLRL